MGPNLISGAELVPILKAAGEVGGGNSTAIMKTMLTSNIESRVVDRRKI